MFWSNTFVEDHLCRLSHPSFPFRAARTYALTMTAIYIRKQHGEIHRDGSATKNSVFPKADPWGIPKLTLPETDSL